MLLLPLKGVQIYYKKLILISFISHALVSFKMFGKRIVSPFAIKYLLFKWKLEWHHIDGRINLGKSQESVLQEDVSIFAMFSCVELRSQLPNY